MFADADGVKFQNIKDRATARITINNTVLLFTTISPERIIESTCDQMRIKFVLRFEHRQRTASNVLL